MRNGDLSSQVVPRLCVVFEGTLGYLPPEKLPAYNRAGTLGNWDAAMACWELDALAMAKISDLVIRQSVQIELVTYVAPPDGAEALAKRLDEESLPVSRVVSSTPARMARRLAYAPDIARVYDADPGNVLLYGGKGRHLTSVHQLGRF